MSGPPVPHPLRDYASLLDHFDPVPHPLPAHLREDRMRAVVDPCWDLLGGRGVSWVGFYLKHPQRGEMTLGPCRDKPACSPIGLHGVCGRSWLDRRPIIVRDVTRLGSNYVACDPLDRSELVVPLFEADGHCWGVLDADSHDPGCFGATDVIGLTALVERAGLSAPQRPAPIMLRL